MITKELKSFLITAQAGSFQKASEQLYLSSTALIKQINMLEDEVGVPLFYRTNKGLTLTESGKVFYDATQDILQRYHTAILAAQEARDLHVNPIKIGFSQINPHYGFDAFYAYETCFTGQFTTQIVPISCEYKDFTDELRNLGEHVDVIPYYFGHFGISSVCNSFCLARLPLCVGVPVDHPLCKKETLAYEDLNGYDLLTIKSEANCYYNVFNNDILSNAPNVKLHFFNYFDINTLNYAASCKQLVLAGSYLKNAHPLIKLIPIKWEHYLPYGLYYSQNPPSTVQMLLQDFINNGISGKVEDAPIIPF